MVLKHVWAAPRQEVEKKRTGTGWILKFPGITVPLVSAGGSTVRLLRGQKVIEVTYEDVTPTPIRCDPNPNPQRPGRKLFTSCWLQPGRVKKEIKPLTMVNAEVNIRTWARR